MREKDKIMEEASRILDRVENPAWARLHLTALLLEVLCDLRDVLVEGIDVYPQKIDKEP